MKIRMLLVTIIWLRREDSYNNETMIMKSLCFQGCIDQIAKTILNIIKRIISSTPKIREKPHYKHLHHN